MSLETKAALDAALAAHIADEGENHILTGYALIACGMNTDNFDRESTNYFYEWADSQPFHSSIGLAHVMVDYLTAWRGEPDEDDGE